MSYATTAAKVLLAAAASALIPASNPQFLPITETRAEIRPGFYVSLVRRNEDSRIIDMWRIHEDSEGYCSSMRMDSEGGMDVLTERNRRFRVRPQKMDALLDALRKPELELYKGKKIVMHGDGPLVKEQYHLAVDGRIFHIEYEYPASIQKPGHKDNSIGALSHVIERITVHCPPRPSTLSSGRP